MKNIMKYMKKPSKIVIILMNLGIFNWLTDKQFLKLKYQLVMKKKLNLQNPQTFNEKLQWLKLYDRNPEYTKMVDKYEAKKYVANIIGEEYIIPTLGVWEKFEDIDFEKLPNQFVLKPTHTSGNVFICKDKNKIDYEKLKKEVNQWLKRKYYYLHREWPYKNVKPKIIAEKYMGTSEQEELIDYKFFCFNGKVKIVLICSDRKKDLKETFYDENWNLLELKEGRHKRDFDIKKPYNFEKMKEFTDMLAKDKSFVRIDFYEINKKIYFGEITFYPKSGYEDFEQVEWDKKLGDMLELPKQKVEERK